MNNMSSYQSFQEENIPYTFCSPISPKTFFFFSSELPSKQYDPFPTQLLFLFLFFFSVWWIMSTMFCNSFFFLFFLSQGQCRKLATISVKKLTIQALALRQSKGIIITILFVSCIFHLYCILYLFSVLV